MTRQKKVLNVVLREMDTILERTDVAMDSYGTTLEANAIFSESLAGKTADFKNSMEELFTTIVSSDAIKSLVDTSTDFADTLLVIEDDFGLLNTALAITIPLFIALKGEMVATKAVGLMNFIYKLAISIDGLGVSAGLASVGISTLSVAMGGIAGVIAAVVAVQATLSRQHKELIQDTKTFNSELDESIAQWGKLNDEQKENIKLNAELTLQKLINEYTEAKEKIDEVNEEVERLREITKPGSGVDYTSRLVDNLEDAIEKQADYNLVIETYEKSQNLANGSLEKYLDSQESLNQKVEDGTALQAYWEEKLYGSTKVTEDQTEANENLEESMSSVEDIIKEITEDYEFMSDAGKAEARARIQAEINKTRATKEEVLKRITAYEQEFEAFKASIVLSEGFLSPEQFDTFKTYQNLISGARDEVEALTISENKYIKGLDDLNNTSDKTTKVLTEQEKKIKALTESLNLLQAQEDYTETLDEKNSLREQQIGILEKLQEVVGEGTLEWYQYGNQIKSVQSEIDGQLNQSIDDSITLLEEFNDKLEKQADLLENRVTDAFNEQLEALEDAYDKDAEKLENSIDKKEEELDLLQEKRKAEEEAIKQAEKQIELEKAMQKLQNISQEKNVRVFREGVGFVFEADPRALKAQQEEISRIEEEIRQDGIDAEKDAEEKKLQNQIDKLKKQENELKKSYDKQVDKVKDAMSEMSDITDLELADQNGYWDEWLNNNSSVLSSFQNEIANTISKIEELNNQQISAKAKIEEKKESKYKDTGDPDTVLVKRKSDGQVAELPRSTYEHLKNDPDIGHDYERLNTGGRTLSDGLAMLHKDEVVSNPAQVSRLVSAVGLPNGSAMQNAKTLHSFANMPKLSNMGSNGGEVMNFYGDLKFPNVKSENDAQSFMSEIQNMKRYNRTRS